MDTNVQDQPAARQSDRPVATHRRGSDRLSKQDLAEIVGTCRKWWSGISVPFSIGASRVGLGLIFAHLIVVLLPQSRQHLSNGSLSNGTWLGAFDRWDSVYYLGIAQHGYPINNVSQTAFFPGYSFLVAAMHAISLGSLTYLQSAIAVSWVAFTAAAILLYRLTTRIFGPRVALIATALFCWFPASLFFLAPYSEALFALEILVVVTLIERNQLLAASIVAAFASATSPESIALTAAIMIAAVVARKGVQWVLLYGAVSLAGIGAYMLYLWSRFSDPVEFASVQNFGIAPRTFHSWGCIETSSHCDISSSDPGPPPADSSRPTQTSNGCGSSMTGVFSRPPLLRSSSWECGWSAHDGVGSRC